MNTAIWILAGGAIGWAAYALLHVNQRWGATISILIGITGGLLGGDLLAPMLGAGVESEHALNPFALVVAAAGAAGCLIISNLLSGRYRI